jgi:hypothetical protein
MRITLYIVLLIVCEFDTISNANYFIYSTPNYVGVRQHDF